MSSRIDVHPNPSTLQEYYTLLLAEMETLVLAPEVGQEGGISKPAIRAVAPASESAQASGKGGKSNVCRS